MRWRPFLKRYLVPENKTAAHFAPLFLYVFGPAAHNIGGGMHMHEEEKKPTPWEAGDPKLPVVKADNMEKRRAY